MALEEIVTKKEDSEVLQNLVNETDKEGAELKSSYPSDIESYLSGYKETPLNANGPTISSPPQGNTTQTLPPPPISNDPDAPYGRYKSGAKAGKPKPAPKAPLKFSYNAVPNETASLSGEILTGALLITLVDLIMPIVVSVVNNKFFGGVKINPSDLSLTAKQRNELAPVADNVLRRYKIQADPLVVLLVGLFGIYSVNLFAARMKGEFKQAEKEADKEKDSNVVTGIYG